MRSGFFCRISGRPLRHDSASELLSDAARSNGHTEDLEQGALSLSERSLGSKKLDGKARGERLEVEVTGGSEAGERSPLLSKSRSAGRLDDGGSLSRSSSKSPSLSRYNR